MNNETLSQLVAVIEEARAWLVEVGFNKVLRDAIEASE